MPFSRPPPLPERGCIGIFNRSCYREVLIVKVHPEILCAESLPEEIAGDDKENARLIVSQVIFDTLDALKIGCPKPGKRHREELQDIRKQLET